MVQDFRTPHAFTVAIAAVAAIALAIVTWMLRNESNGINHDPAHAVTFAAAMFALITGMGWVLSRQHIRIEGTRIGLRSISTLYRWREFDTSDVEQIGFDDANAGGRAAVSALVLRLRRTPGRRWRKVRIIDHVFMGEGDSPLMSALTQALRRGRDIGRSYGTCSASSPERTRC
ncbi:hypothetical protein [Luteimonas sp. R10]|uniref:hypothetical protein n=1 Tax=Luteimonas sp. R10 TaxID=3108176 RepID=UPI00308DCF3C|nr:hypothetical protein U3649_17450 [Luteimonas sp. R10]